MRVLGVDPGLTRCGIGIVDGDNYQNLQMVGVGVIRTDVTAPLEARLLQLEVELITWIKKYTKIKDVKYSKDDPKVLSKSQLSASETYLVKKGTWHQVINPYDTPCHIIEIQFGEQTIESDIERYSYYENNEIT